MTNQRLGNSFHVRCSRVEANDNGSGSLLWVCAKVVKSLITATFFEDLYFAFTFLVGWMLKALLRALLWGEATAIIIRMKTGPLLTLECTTRRIIYWQRARHRKLKLYFGSNGLSVLAWAMCDSKFINRRICVGSRSMHLLNCIFYVENWFIILRFWINNWNKFEFIFRGDFEKWMCRLEPTFGDSLFHRFFGVSFHLPGGGALGVSTEECGMENGPLCLRTAYACCAKQPAGLLLVVRIKWWHISL